MIRLLLTLALFGYLVAWLLQIRTFRARGADPRTRSLGFVLGAAALHGSALAAFSFLHDTLPLVGLGPAGATLALAFAVAFLIAAGRASAWTAGLLILPCIALLLSVALVAGLEPTAPATPFRGVWLAIHVTSVFTGYASLLLASVAALMYLFQFRALKQKEFGSVFRFFPSLDGLDRLSDIGLLAGLGALTVGLIVGWSFTLTFGRGFALGDPEVALGVLTWASYGAAAVAHRLPSWRGWRAAAVSVAALVICTAVFLALRATAGSGGFFL